VLKLKMDKQNQHLDYLRVSLEKWLIDWVLV